MNILNFKIENYNLLWLTLAIALDMISGCIKAIINKQFKSSEFRTGLLKKVLDYVLYIVGVIVDSTLTLNYVGNAVLTCLIFMELYSVLENLNGVIAIPNVLKDIVNEEIEKEESGDK